MQNIIPTIRPICPILLLLAASASAFAAELSPRAEEIKTFLKDERVSIMPTLDNAGAWQSLVDSDKIYKHGIIDRAVAIAKKPVPEWDGELYLEFSRNGVRKNWETANWRKKSNLNTLFYAECLEREGCFIPAICAYMEAFAAQPTWVMPAHDRSLGDFYGRTITVDLSSSLFSAKLVTMLTVLGDRLPADTRATIEAAVMKFVVGPTLSRIRKEIKPQWWMNGANNWNAVCWHGVVESALGLDIPLADKAEIIAAAEAAIPRYLGGFSDDGICTEGIGYWNYGMGHYVMMAELVRFATDGKLDWLALPAAEKPLCGPLYTEVLSGVQTTFSDCKIGDGPSPRLVAWIDARMGFDLGTTLPRVNPTDDTLAALIAFTTPEKIAGADRKIARGVAESRTFLPGAEILICRAADRETPFAAVIKGGHNNENHNQNDVGTFAVYAGKNWLIADPGAEVYTKDTFDNTKRYKSPFNNSFGHSVPLLGTNTMQSTGQKFKADILRHTFTDAHDSLEMDLSGAYEFAPLVKLVRTFDFYRGNDNSAVAESAVEITDTFEYDSPKRFETAFIIFGDAEMIDENTIRITTFEGVVADVRVAASGKWSKVSEPFDERQQIGSKGFPNPTRVAISLDAPATSGFVKLRIEHTK